MKWSSQFYRALNIHDFQRGGQSSFHWFCVQGHVMWDGNWIHHWDSKIKDHSKNHQEMLSFKCQYVTVSQFGVQTLGYLIEIIVEAFEASLVYFSCFILILWCVLDHNFSVYAEFYCWVKPKKVWFLLRTTVVLCLARFSNETKALKPCSVNLVNIKCIIFDAYGLGSFLDFCIISVKNQNILHKTYF